MEEELINIDNLTISFNGNVLLDNASFTGYSGKVYGLYGKNGSGKTSLINALTGFIKPQDGIIELFGKTINKLTSYKISILGEGISRTFQVPDIDEDSTIYENLTISKRFYNESFINLIYKKNNSERMINELDEEILKYLKLFDLPGNTKANKLSYGVKRLISVIMCLLTGSRILLFDEPFANLNPRFIEILKSLFRDVTRQHSKLIIIVEHQPDNILEFADTLLHITNKTISSYDINADNKKDILEKIIDSSFVYE